MMDLDETQEQPMECDESSSSNGYEYRVQWGITEEIGKC